MFATPSSNKLITPVAILGHSYADRKKKCPTQFRTYLHSGGRHTQLILPEHPEIPSAAPRNESLPCQLHAVPPKQGLRGLALDKIYRGAREPLDEAPQCAREKLPFCSLLGHQNHRFIVVLIFRIAIKCYKSSREERDPWAKHDLWHPKPVGSVAESGCVVVIHLLRLCDLNSPDLMLEVSPFLFSSEV